MPRNPRGTKGGGTPELTREEPRPNHPRGTKGTGHQDQYATNQCQGTPIGTKGGGTPGLTHEEPRPRNPRGSKKGGTPGPIRERGEDHRVSAQRTEDGVSAERTTE